MKADNVWLNIIKTTPALPFKVCDSQCPVEWIPSVTFRKPYQGSVGQWRMLLRRRKCWYSSKSVRSITGREYYTRMMSTAHYWLCEEREGRNGVRKGKYTVRIVRIESTHSWKNIKPFSLFYHFFSLSLFYHFFSLSLFYHFFSLSLFSPPSLESGQENCLHSHPQLTNMLLHTTFLL